MASPTFSRSERYRFKLVVDELRAAKTDDYRTVLLAFVNCLIISTPQLKVLKSVGPSKFFIEEAVKKIQLKL